MGDYGKDLEKRLRESTTSALDQIKRAGFSPDAAKRNVSERQRKNIYQCQTCLGLICTIDRDAGVTPFMIRCYAKDDCSGHMQSSFYVTHPMLTPTFEWYRPDAAELATKNSATVAHVEQGGLILRPIKQEAS